ncbi:glycosyltransferase [Pirellulaceae bacterium]|jgi:glycosyltransferase involved in cell wall biosynthesis|nr:glycosyltransferase [Pirellulaceae bacterium]
MKIAVVLTTYNSPVSLRKSLLGYVAQDEPDFEILVADDGSDGRTGQVLKEDCFSSLNLKHVWQADDGYRVSAIRNLAITQTDADYLIFSDGDVIPRRDFVANHRREARPSTYTTGSRINIPERVHKQFTDSQILENQIFDSSYLKKMSVSIRFFRRLSLNSGPIVTNIMNILQWRHCVFFGSNTGAWREDVLKVNGFDENFPGYGSEDRDIGFRLKNQGVKFRYLKHSILQYHMAHPRPYLSAEILALNRSVMRSRMRSTTTWIATGIHKLQADVL